MAIKLLELAKKIFGPKKVSQQMGTKTGVKLLSGGKNDPFKGIYNVEMLKNNPKALAEAKKQLENNLGYAFSNKNTLEIQRFEKNLEAVDAAMNPKSADVIPFKKDEGFIPIRKDQIDDIESAIKADEGIVAADAAKEIVKKRTKDMAKGDVTGETSDLMKDLEGRLKKIQEYAKKMDDPMGDFENFVMKDPFRPGGPLDPKIGIVRTAAREILHKNQKAGKLKILDKEVANNIEKYIPSGEDPITTLRKYYGEAGLEALDAHADELLNAQGYGEINAILTKNKLFDLTPKKVPGYDQSIVTAEKIRKAKEQEAKNRQILEVFDPTDRTKNADGGLIDILKL